MNKKENKTRKSKPERVIDLGVVALIMMLAGLLIIAAIPLVQASQATIDDKTALQKGISHLKEKASEWGIKDAQGEFRLRRIVRDDLGEIHVRLDQEYKGVPVFGNQLIVHLNGDGTLKSITGSYMAGINSKTQPVITGQVAKGKAMEQFSGQVTYEPEVELMLYPVDGKAVLVYRIALENDNIPARVVMFIDAADGKVVGKYDDLQTPAVDTQSQTQSDTKQALSLIQEQISAATPSANGTGYSLYSGTVGISTVYKNNNYLMVDSTRGTGTTISGYLRTVDMNNKLFGSGTIFTDADNFWGNFLNSNRQTAGVDAHFGAEMTWDYYLNTHNRHGIFNDSKGTLSKVHYGKNYNNAYWSDSCKCMTYGDGDGTTFSSFVALDVVGHEMTHGVTTAVAGLIYSQESGGLNEAMSDIFGAMMEYYSSTHGAAKTPNYLIGEDIYTPGTPGDALRYMADPTQDGVSIDTYLDYYNGLDVHYSSGIANNAFYLLAEGGTHRLGGVVTGIGREKADQIFFRALDVYMVPSENFSQARSHTIQAATDLYGASSQEVASVKQAWNAVAVV